VTRLFQIGYIIRTPYCWLAVVGVNPTSASVGETCCILLDQFSFVDIVSYTVVVHC